MSFPAITTGASDTVIIIVSLSGLQVPFPVVETVKTANFEVTSEALKQYVMLGDVLFAVNVPPPNCQITPVATVLTVVNGTQGLLEQTFANFLSTAIVGAAA